MTRSIKSLLVAGVIAALFSALGVGIVFAQDGGDGSEEPTETTEETKKSRASSARDFFAAALGVTVEELEAAYQQVALDRVDDAVEAGKLTEEKAEEFRTAIESGEGKGRFLAGHLLKRGGSGNGEALAEELGLTVDDLAAAREQVALDRVDDAVEAGKITEERAEELRTAIESGEKLDRSRGHHKASGKNCEGGDKSDSVTFDKAKTE